MDIARLVLFTQGRNSRPDAAELLAAGNNNIDSTWNATVQTAFNWVNSQRRNDTWLEIIPGAAADYLPELCPPQEYLEHLIQHRVRPVLYLPRGGLALGLRPPYFKEPCVLFDPVEALWMRGEAA